MHRSNYLDDDSNILIWIEDVVIRETEVNTLTLVMEFELLNSSCLVQSIRAKRRDSVCSGTYSYHYTGECCNHLILGLILGLILDLKLSRLFLMTIVTI